MKKVVYWIIAILLVLFLPWYIGIPGAVIAYFIYKARKNSVRQVPQPSIQELERQRVMQRNRAIINGYLADRTKFAKNTIMMISKSGAQVWISILLKQML